MSFHRVRLGIGYELARVRVRRVRVGMGTS